MIVAGIDPSTYVGMVKTDGQEHVGKAVNFPKLKGWQRLHSIANEVGRTLNLWNPDLVVIEGYAYGNTNSLVTLVEIGTLIRKIMYDLAIPWYDCPPTSLKKWVAGKGNASKPVVGEFVLARWGFKSPSDDIVDAFALAQLGVEIGQKGVTPGLRGVVRGW